MRMRTVAFKESDLVLCSVRQHLENSLNLMRLANKGIIGAKEIAELSLNRYFEIIEEKA